MRRRDSAALTSRSYLYAPGHDPERLETAFDHGADVVVFDLEDGVPSDRKEEARERVAAALRARPAWVRVNPAGTVASKADLGAVRGLAAGLRLPKTQSPDDVRWLLDRNPGVPVICSIESARGVAVAQAIAAVPGVQTLSLGSGDLTAELGCVDAWDELLAARSGLVAACRSAGLVGPVDSVYYAPDDPDGLRVAAEAALRLGFSGKSTLWPAQVATINDAFGQEG
jgi:citrate lyase subunit beta/citryl-CoA lyase